MKHSADLIEHEGEIVSVNGVIAQARIRQISGCAMCHAQGHCMLSDTVDKVIDLNVSEDMTLRAGDRVIIAADSSGGIKAVLYAYVIPSVIFITALAVASRYTPNEMLIGGIALGVLVPYYFVLYLYREKMKKNFNFYIKCKVSK